MRNLTRITSGPFIRIRIRSDHLDRADLSLSLRCFELVGVGVFVLCFFMGVLPVFGPDFFTFFTFSFLNLANKSFVG